MENLELQLQNDIIMYSRPIYPFVEEIKDFSDWYDGEDAFHQENKIRWVFDAIRLRKEIQREIIELKFNKFRYSFWTTDIAGNFL